MEKKKKKTYKAFLEPDTENVHAATSRQTFLRWEKHSQGSSQAKDNDIGIIPQSAGQSSLNVTPPAEGSLDPAMLIAEGSSEDEPNYDRAESGAESDSSSFLSEIFGQASIRNEQSSDDSEEDADHAIPMDFENNDDILEDEVHDPRDIFDNILMFEAAGLTVTQVLTMVQGLSLRFYLSNEATTALHKLIKVLAGPRFEHLNLSKYTVAQRFNPPEKNISYTFFCKQCCTTLLGPIQKNSIPKQNVQVCGNCQKDYQLSSSSLHCFLSVDIEYQIRAFLENPTIQPILMERLRIIKENTRNPRNDICDVHDGQVYKDVVKKNSLIDKNVLTFNFNTDGAAWFHSSTKSGWPIQIICNELPPRIRFKNLILAGLWLAESEPSPQIMNLYMSTFIDQARKLMENQMIIKSSTGENILFEILFLYAPVDSVARPIMQNRLQFNGYMGCSWCYEHGEFYDRAMRYPLNENDCDLRTHDEYLADIADAQNMGRNIRGVKGFSALTRLRSFDCVWGFTHEYMHGVLLGVTRQLWELWTRPGTAWQLNAQDQLDINRRLLNIKSIKEIHRDPRSLKNRAKWKASEWRSWLLFYCIPCLFGILRPEIFRSLLLFVRSIHILLSMNITEDDLMRCEIDLVTFVGECQVIYGKGAMTFNVHSLTHIVQNVRKSGPLWATSAFPFESGIYNLKRHIHGSKGICDQIVNGSLQMYMFQNSVVSMPDDSACTAYCKALFSGYKVSNFVRLCNDVILIGKTLGTNGYQILIEDEMIDAMGEAFSKCIYRGIVLHSKRYARVCNKTKDNIVQLQSGSIVEIVEFVIVNETCYIKYIRLLTTLVEEQGLQVTHLLQIDGYEERPQLECIANVKCKVILIDVFERSYICIPPNVFEIQ